MPGPHNAPQPDASQPGSRLHPQASRGARGKERAARPARLRRPLGALRSLRFPFLRLSRREYIALTVAAVLVPSLVLSLLGLHLVRQMYRFQNDILAEYSRFSVEYTAAEIERAIATEQRGIAAALQLASLVEQFDIPAELARAEASYPTIEDAFVLDAGGALAFTSQQLRAARIARHVLDRDTVQHLQLSGDLHQYTGDDEGPYQLWAFPLRDAQGNHRGIFGFFLDEEYLRRELVGRILETTIQQATGRFAPDFGEVLTLVVRDETGAVVFAHRHLQWAERDSKRAEAPTPSAGAPTPSRSSARDLAEASLAGVLPGWRVGLTYAKESGFGWMRRIVGVQVALLVLAAGLVILGTLLTMRFALQQMELSRLKSHFVSNITHELKTPLAAIRLYTETLQQGRVRDRSEADRFLGIVYKEAARLTTLIDNLLDFSRIEAGRRRYSFAPGRAGEVVREVVDAYAYQLGEQGFDVHVDIEPGLPESMLDRDALGQAILNLLDNAVKYSGESRSVWVAVHRAPGAGDGVRIAVRDAGVGIAAAELERIFEAFYRVEKGLQHDVKGSGLGLAVVKHIAEAHGGRVEVRSHPGQGSTFTLHLPSIIGTAEEAPWTARRG